MLPYCSIKCFPYILRYSMPSGNTWPTNICRPRERTSLKAHKRDRERDRDRERKSHAHCMSTDNVNLYLYVELYRESITKVPENSWKKIRRIISLLPTKVWISSKYYDENRTKYLRNYRWISANTVCWNASIIWS